ncbi:MAG TPA: DUF790 family protein [Gemmatimonadaceae bacterium]|nr:DUF790 family protein [Gemmatimonadaceae bacterium]
MLRRVHVAPFVRVERGVARLRFLADPDGRVVPFLDRMCHLVRRLEGRPRRAVAEALRRQARRVRDAARLAGVAKALLDLCEFRAPEGAERAPAVRDALFRSRATHWPPVPGDRGVPYAEAARALGLESADEVERLLYADAPDAYVLVQAPDIGGRALLARYNLELARGLLLDAVRVRVTARGGWRGIFRAAKLARLMYRVERAGRRSYRVELTGPASPFLTRRTRYGARFARVVPALARAPEWRLEADLALPGGTEARFRLRGRARAGQRGGAPVGELPRRAGYDSAWEASLAGELRRRIARVAAGAWRLTRETTPVPLGDGELFLPDFTLRHADGREAIVELVGFWTPEYLAEKLRKVAAARLDNLVLVVYRGLAVGAARDELESAASSGAGAVVWFGRTPNGAAVLAAAERVARAAP